MKQGRTKRFLAVLMAAAMLLQQSSIGTLAAETEPETTAVTEAATETQVTEDASEGKTEAATDEAATENESETESETETGTEKQTEAVSEKTTEAESETETEAVTEKEAETETETETATETEAPKTNFTYEDSRVIITAVADVAANLPQDAQIHADYMEPGTPAYNEAAAVLEAAYAGQDVVLDYVFYDIYFTAASAGEGRIEPEAGTVTVSMQFKQPVLEVEEDVEVQSYDVVHVDNGVAEIVANSVQTTEDGSVASVGFTSSEFSPYAFVLNAAKKPNAPILLTGLNGEFQDLEDFITDVEFVGAVTQDGAYIIEPNKQYTLKLSFAEQGEQLQLDDSGEYVYQLPAGFPATVFASQNMTVTIKDTDGKSYDVQGVYSVDDEGYLHINLSKDSNYEKFTASTNVKFKLEFGFSFTGEETTTEFPFTDSTTKKVTFESQNGVTVEKSSDYNEATGKVTYTITVTSIGQNTNVLVDDTMTGSALNLNNDFKVYKKTGDGKTEVSDVTVNSKAESQKGFTLNIPSMDDGDVYIIEYTADVDYSKVNGSFDNNATLTGNNVTATPGEDHKPGSDDDKVEHLSHYRLDKSDGTVGETIDENGYKNISWSIDINKDHIETIKPGMSVTDILKTEGLEYSGNGLQIIVTPKDGAAKDPINILWQDIISNETSWTIQDLKTLLINHGCSEDDVKNAYVQIKYDTKINALDIVGSKDVTNHAEFDGTGDDGKATVPGSGDVELVKTVADSLNPKETIKWHIDFTVTGTVNDCTLEDTLPSQYFANVNGYTGHVYDFLDGGFTVNGLCENEWYDVEEISGDSYTIDQGVASNPPKTAGYRFKFYHVNGNIDPKEATTEQKIFGLVAKSDGEPHVITIDYSTKTNDQWLKMENVSTHTNTVKHVKSDKSSSTSVTIADQSIDKVLVTENWSDNGNYTWYIQDDPFVKEVTRNEITYPLFYFGLCFEGIITDSITITDTFLPNELTYYGSFAPIFLAGDNQLYSANAGSASVVVNSSEAGELTFTINNIPQKSDGTYYKRYGLVYCMIPTDEDALKKLLEKDTDGKPNGFTNIANLGSASDSVTVTWDYQPLTKDAVRDYTKEANILSFTIDYNKDKFKLLQGSTELKFKDSMENLRFLPDTLTVTSDGEILSSEEGYGYDYDENGDLIITVFNGDEHHIVIKYDARVIGSSGDVNYSNTVEVEGTTYSKEVSKNYYVTSNGAGSGDLLGITLHKYRKGFMKHGLAGAQYRLDKKNAQGVYEPMTRTSGEEYILTTGTDGTLEINSNTVKTDTTEVGLYENTWYRLVEVSAPSGYALDPQPREFYFSSDGTTGTDMYLAGDHIYVPNAKEDFHIIKKDADDASVLLQGAEFTLYNNDDCKEEHKVVGPVATDINGKVSFSGLSAGNYYLKETKAPEGYILSTVVYQIEITADGVEGKNGLVFTSDDENSTYFATITNSKQVGSLKVTKTITGNNTKNTDEFTFKVTLTGTGADAVDGTYGDMEFADGVSTFKLKGNETQTAQNLPVGLTYKVEETDANGYVLTSSSGTTGKIVVTNAGAIPEAKFTNTRNKAIAEFEVEKHYNSTFPTAEDEQFSFTLTAGQNSVVPTISTPMPAGSSEGKKIIKVTGTVAGSATNTFGEITYEKDGTYEYTITENPGKIHGVTYDPKIYHFSVDVATNPNTGEKSAAIYVAEQQNAGSASGQYTLKQGSEYTAVFTNIYVPDGSANFSVQKTYDAAFPTGANAFVFTLTAKENNVTPSIQTPMPSGANGSTSMTINAGTTSPVPFGEITYSKDGDYEYEITEVTTGTGVLADVIYDQKVYHVKVSVSTNNNIKTAKVSYKVNDAQQWTDTNDAAFTATFTNYKVQNASAELKVKKIYAGSNDIIPDGGFSFVLEAEGGAPMPSDADGISKTIWVTKDELKNSTEIEKSFGTITYTENESYTYTITETVPTGAQDGVSGNIKYDTRKYTVTVDVTPAAEPGKKNVTVSYTADTTTNGTIAEFVNSEVQEETVSVSVKKVWNDNDDDDNIRPISVTVQLLANSNEVANKTVALSEANSWSVKWTDLPKYDSTGEKIEYSVKEVPVPDGYTVEIKRDTTAEGVDYAFTITNTHTPTPEPTPTPTPAPEATPTPTPEITPTPTPEETPTPTPEETPTPTPEETPTPTPEATPAPTPEATPTPTPEATPSPTPTPTPDIHFNVNKTDVGTGEEVEGAQLTVYDSEGNVVDSWTSKKGETHDFGSRLIPGESYTLREEVAPDGYGYVTDIQFTIEEDGTVTTGMPSTTDENGNTTYLVEDSQIHLNVNKTETGTGEEVEGAVLELLDSNGNVVDSWTSKAGETHDFGSRLKAGESYTLRESITPDGYLVATDITFTVNADGSITTDAVTSTDAAGSTVYLMEDSLKPQSHQGRISVTKTQVDADGTAIGGQEATFYVALFADEARTKRISPVKEVHFGAMSLTSTAAVFENLGAGTYYVSETDAEGNAIESGLYRDVVFWADYPNGDAVTLETDSFSGQLNFNNQFYELPPGYMYMGELQITKAVQKRIKKGSQETTEEYPTTGVFYAGIFNDPEYTDLYGMVPIEVNGTSSSTVVIELPVSEDPGVLKRTYYVTEVDENGIPLVNGNDLGFVFDVNGSGTGTTVEVSSDSTVEYATITNTYIEEIESEVITETEKQTETQPSTTTTKAAQTGDATNYWIYLFLLVMSAGTAAVVTAQKRREKKNMK